MSCMTGAQTRCLRNAPSVLSFAAVGGRFEGEGPLRDYFDELSEDHFFGEKTWEKGESAMQRRALSHALEKAALRERDLDLIFAGDLLNQCTGSSFALRSSRCPSPSTARWACAASRRARASGTAARRCRSAKR